MSIDDLTQEDINRKLAALPAGLPQHHYPPGLLSERQSPAAVLIPLQRRGEAWHVVYIRRTEVPHDRHSGQVAFPGGRMETGDADVLAAALRETQEEINLTPGDVQVLGQLNDFITVSDFKVTPVVGVAPWPYEFEAQPGEVSRIFSIPLAWLADEDNRRTVARQLSSGWQVPVIYFDEYDGEILWGASARFTVALLEAIT